MSAEASRSGEVTRIEGHKCLPLFWHQGGLIELPVVHKGVSWVKEKDPRQSSLASEKRPQSPNKIEAKAALLFE